MGFPGHGGMPPLAPAPPVMELMDDEPPNKKSRQEDHLMPEDMFMQMHKVRAISIHLISESVNTLF